MNLVAMKRSFFGSVIFLCRRQSPAKAPILLPVDDTHYKWVDSLKVRIPVFGIFGFPNLFLTRFNLAVLRGERRR